MDGGVGPSCSYPPYRPGYWILPSYAPFPGFGHGGDSLYRANIYGGRYPIGGSGNIGSVISPFAPRSPWYGTTMIGAGALPLPQSRASLYTPYLGGGVGVMGMGAGGYNGVLGQRELEVGSGSLWQQTHAS